MTVPYGLSIKIYNDHHVTNFMSKDTPFRSFWLGATFNLSTSKGIPRFFCESNKSQDFFVNPIKANKSQDFFVNFYWLFLLVSESITKKVRIIYLFSLCCRPPAKSQPSTTLPYESTKPPPLCTSHNLRSPCGSKPFPPMASY
jgi:hypothetical protein